MNDFLSAAAAAGRRTESGALPQNMLSFELEFPAAPDLDRLRADLERELGGDGFDLVLPSTETPQIVLLRFTGLVAEQSADFLFAVAQDLVDELQLVSATPNIPPPWLDLFAVGPETEGISDLFWRFCSSQAEEPADPQWARKLLRVDLVDAVADGSGIRIGQPDTGVGIHRELDEGVDRAGGYNVLDDVADPTDPLSPSMGTPGHGTATSSAAVSRATRTVVGTAPGATLIPIRCLDNVVIGSGVSVAKAIDRAVQSNCNVITMSLGGPIPGPSLGQAIARAVAADVIVLAAAGNCVQFVVYPAWDANVIAVAGIDHNDNLWRGSSYGEAVDICAPGENVYVARRQPVPPGHTPTAAEFEEVNTRGQGTSFAVALTAGVAALWLQHFGLAAVRAEATRRGLTVHHLFRAALMASARRPDGWDDTRMGAGVVDAKALLDLKLEDIPGPPPIITETPAMAAFGAGVATETRFVAEANYLAADWRLRSEPETAPSLESAVRPRPSPQLAGRMPAPSGAAFPAPAAIAEPATPPVPLAVALRSIGGTRGQLPGGEGGISSEAARGAIAAEGVGSIMGRARERMERRRTMVEGIDAGAQERALAAMERTVGAFLEGAPEAAASSAVRRVQAEALVRLVGRPALRITPDGGEITDPEIDIWAADLVPTHGIWRPLADAVGRIDVEVDGVWRHAGTGTLMSDGRVLTNRHVLDVFAEPWPSRGGQAFAIRRPASIIFDADASDETKRFPIRGVIGAGPRRIGSIVDLSALDAALLEIDTGVGIRPVSELTRAVHATQDAGISQILVIGYPAEPAFSSGPNADDPDYLAFWTRIRELFGFDYGVKYANPGLIMAKPHQVPGDSVGWVFSHDATTLGGNSGSLVLTLRPDIASCGLHFGGSALSMNLAHDLTVVSGLPDGAFLAGIF